MKLKLGNILGTMCTAMMDVF